MSDVSGLTAVVTGAGSGIGLATARTFARGGAHVYGLDVRAGEMEGVARWVPCNVASSESVARAFAIITASSAVLDVVVNNAGVSAVGTIEDAEDAEWAHVLSVNVTGAARVTKAALPLLRRSSHASVVNVCSIAASVGLPKRAVYSASKGAIEALTRAMAADLVSEGIRVNGVSPGTADTPWVARLLRSAADPVAERGALERRQPSGRLVAAEEVASAIRFLASPEQASVTGAVVAVDGGVSGLRLPAHR